MKVGIDFGTTNSSLAYYGADGALRNVGETGNMATPVPSVVAIRKTTGEVLVGKDAWNRRRELAADDDWEIVTSVKTLLGSDWRRQIAGRVWTATDIAAEIFKQLKRKVESAGQGTAYGTGLHVDSAVVAIPVGFDAEKRKRLRNAAEMADIVVDSFVSESTAAFVNSRDEMRAASVIVVFDWGGGTLDISILKQGNDTVRELATSGMAEAGDAIDDKLARHIHSSIAFDQNLNVSFDDMPVVYQDRLVAMSEQAKRSLSQEDSATVGFLERFGQVGPFSKVLRRDWFAGFVRPVVDNAVSCMKRAMNQAHVGVAEIDRILVVGGSSNLVSLRERLIDEFGEERLHFAHDSEWSVSRGSAKLGASTVTCKSSQTVGIVLSDDRSFPMLREGETIHGEWDKTFRFGITDTSEEAHLVFCGAPDIDSSPDSYRCIHVPAYRFLQEKLEIEAWIDANLVFYVTARSDMHRIPADRQPVWRYERLKFYYEFGNGGL